MDRGTRVQRMRGRQFFLVQGVSPDAVIGKQGRAQGPVAEAQYAAPPAAQTCRRDDCVRKDQWRAAMHQQHFAHVYPGTLPAEQEMFVRVGVAQTLEDHAHRNLSGMCLQSRGQ